MKVKKPFLKVKYKFRGFQDSEDVSNGEHNWHRFPWAWCFSAKNRGRDDRAMKEGRCPVHSSNLKISDPVFKYAEIILDNEGTFIFVSSNEIEAVKEKDGLPYFFRPRGDLDKPKMQSEFIELVRELGEPLKVTDLTKYGFELHRGRMS